VFVCLIREDKAVGYIIKAKGTYDKHFSVKNENFLEYSQRRVYSKEFILDYATLTHAL
jgi:hypothetical protein